MGNPDVDAMNEEPIDFATDPYTIYWPFGEFWRDELGYWVFRARQRRVQNPFPNRLSGDEHEHSFPSSIVFGIVLAMEATTAIPTHAAGARRRRILRARDVTPTPGEQYARLAEERLGSSDDSSCSRGIQGDQKAEMMLQLADFSNKVGTFAERDVGV